MNNFFRAIIAGYGAKKLGGGCFGTIIVFIIIWVALGQCSFSSRSAVPSPETYPADRRATIYDEIQSQDISLWYDVNTEQKITAVTKGSADPGQAVQRSYISKYFEGEEYVADLAEVRLLC
jgi:hypothetical protein